MTAVRWPDGLPQLVRLEGLSAQRASSVIRTEMDAGPVKVRQRYTVSTKNYEGSVILTEAQRRILEEWYRHILGGGALRFQMLNPQTMEYAEFRFRSDYQESAVDGLWEIHMQLEMLNA